MAEQGSATSFVRPGKGRVANKDKVRSGRKGIESFTPKEARFAKGVITEVVPGKINPKTGKPKTKTDVAMEVYETENRGVASSIASENLSKPKFKALMAEAFETAGITPSSMASVLKEAMTATKTASFNGEVMPSDEPDHSVRVSAMKAAASIIGEDKDDDDNGKPTFIFQGGQTFVNQPTINQPAEPAK